MWILSVSLASAGTPAFSSALGTLANAMNAGEWKEFPTLNLDGELLFQNVNGDFWYADMATTWSNYLCWNPGTREMYWLGAPHMGPYAFLRYAETSNAWTSDTNVPDCMRLPNYEGCFNHGYDAGTIDPENGILYYHAETAFFAYAVGTKSWTQWSQSGFSSTRSDGMAFFPPLRKLVHVIGGTIRMIDPETKTSETVATGLEMGAYDNTIEYSPVHRKVFFGGAKGSSSFYAMDSSTKITRLADAPEPFDCTHASLACDPVTGNPLLLSNANKYYVYEPAANRWDTLANPPVALNIPESSAAKPAMATGIADYGVVFYMSPGLKKVYLYKHATSGTSVAGPAGKKLSMGSMDVVQTGTTWSIRYDLGAARKAAFLVQDARGMTLRRFEVSGTRYGQLVWNGKNHLGQPLAAGTYFLRWISGKGNTIQTKTWIAE